LKPEDVRQLFRFIDRMMDLPPGLEALARQEIHRYEEERNVPFMTSFERLARTEELLGAIEVLLRVRFGADGLQLLPEIQQLSGVDLLRSIHRGIETATSLDEVRRIWAPAAPADSKD
jgi:hypothetical protein